MRGDTASKLLEEKTFPDAAGSLPKEAGLASPLASHEKMSVSVFLDAYQSWFQGCLAEIVPVLSKGFFIVSLPTRCAYPPVMGLVASEKYGVSKLDNNRLSFFLAGWSPRNINVNNENFSAIVNEIPWKHDDFFSEVIHHQISNILL